MTFELLISTMHKNIEEIKIMISKMNIHCNCVVINQCDEENYYEEILDNKFLLRVYSTLERGLSKSRNMALKNAIGDIVCIGDDDLYYYDNFNEKIIDYYERTPKADIALFNVDYFRKTFRINDYKCRFWELSSFMSVQCTFKIKKIRDKNLSFNEMFGTGAKYFNSGEENIFLSECKRKGLSIFYCARKILRCDESESSWFTTFNDERFISTRGAIYYSMSRFLYYPYIIRFAIKYRKKLKPYSIFESLMLMEKGKKELLFLLNKNI